MLFGAVALVLCDAVLGIFTVKLGANSVSCNFSEDRCRRDAHTGGITLDHRHCGYLKISCNIAVDNSEISFEFDVPNIKEIPISKSYNDKIMELFVIHSKQK